MAMIFPDPQLRAFNIQNPWPMEDACEHSAEARKSWDYEKNTHNT